MSVGGGDRERVVRVSEPTFTLESNPVELKRHQTQRNRNRKYSKGPLGLYLGGTTLPLWTKDKEN